MLKYALASKYKLYDKIQNSRPRRPPEEAAPSKKRHRSTVSSPPPSHHTPNKRSKTTHVLPAPILDAYDPPTSTYLSPTAHRTSIGPTPQKDGQVLGLFDQLSTEPKSRTLSQRNPQRLGAGAIQATPSKRPLHGQVGLEPGSGTRKSPLSASKKFQPNTFLTPSANRILNSKTPSRNSVSKLLFEVTPAFLRRDSQRAFPGKENDGAEDDISWSPVAMRKPPRLAGKGLSALVKGLRDMEDEKLDEELEMLREIEGQFGPNSKISQPKVLVDDSQGPDMPLGPDGGLESEDEADIEKEGQGRDGKPLKIWKKKGQKRTTRRVLMKPNVAKWKPEPAWKGEAESEEEDEQAVVEQTQTTTQKPDEDYEDELDGEDDANEAAGGKKKTKKKVEGKKQGFVAKVRKISATAHANFRALKIKNKQSKGKRGARFGRRR